LKKNGLILITTPTPPFEFPSLWRLLGVQRCPYHINVHSKNYWIRLFKNKGFKYLGEQKSITKYTIFEGYYVKGFFLYKNLMKLGFVGRIFWRAIGSLFRCSLLFKKD
jgi:hypothetical protein